MDQPGIFNKKIQRNIYSQSKTEISKILLLLPKISLKFLSGKNLRSQKK